MLSRGSVVDHYRSRLVSAMAGDTPAILWLDSLPPYLCRALILEPDAVPGIVDVSKAFTGSSTASIYGALGLRTCTNGFSMDLMSQLPLGGHVAVGPGNSLALVGQALQEMEQREPVRLRNVADWTSLMVWVDADPWQPSSTLVTSVALPSLPHCTFLSNKAARHIPPKQVFSVPTTYALRENLYHESLHQQLSATLLFSDVLIDSYESKKAIRIPIPWRGAEWEPDRVIHATWVYAKLLPMRIEELQRLPPSSAEAAWILEALTEAIPALFYLTSRIPEILPLMQSTGIALMEEICEVARCSLAEAEVFLG